MGMSPTQLTIRHLKQHGHFVQVVERWNQYAKIRQDLFGGIDVVSISPSENYNSRRNLPGRNARWKISIPQNAPRPRPGSSRFESVRSPRSPRRRSSLATTSVRERRWRRA